MKKYNSFKRKDITLVICAYGECEYLEECIRSIIKQTVRPRILISTSTPNEHINSLAEKYRIKVCVNPDGGQIKDYNFAMKQGDSPLVMLMHQDEILHPEFVRRVLWELNRTKDPIIAFTNYIEMHNDRIDKRASLMVWIKRIMLLPMCIKPLARTGHFKRLIQLLGNPITHPTVVCVRNKMPETCFKEEFKASMDWDLWERLSKEEGSFAYVSKVLLYHRMNDANQTSKLFKGSNPRYMEEYEIFNRFWPKTVSGLIMKLYSKAARYY